MKKSMFKVEFTSDKIPSTYYVCLICSEILKTALDCVEHWYKNHRDVKPKVLLCDDDKGESEYINNEERLKERVRVESRTRQSSLMKYIKLKS